jgi:hypothetical protein
LWNFFVNSTFAAVEPFALQQVVKHACGGGEHCDQVTYLDAYLRNPGIGAKTLVVEHPYTDRHYMEEYQRYYASSFRPPPPQTTRVHVLAMELDDEGLAEINRESALGTEKWSEVKHRLQTAYRGFIVLRPLAAAPVGRTVLAPFAGEDVRVFRSIQKHLAHPIGLELAVRGVPFQQQETAVGACATTAVWSALAAAARATGRRGPTPYAITEGATRHFIVDRQLPAESGLELSQVVSSIRACGFAPYVIKASDQYEVFTHSLKCYLASGIPVVLHVLEDSGYHAVTAVGYRMPDDGSPAADVVYANKKARITTTGLARVYVHEDRLGPYARMLLSPPQGDSDLPVLRHQPFRDSQYRYGQRPMKVHSAVVPLYPKLRLTARGLLSVAAEVFPLVRMMFPHDIERLRVDMWFALSGDYARQLLSRGGESADIVAKFVRQTPLPRYVGIIRFRLDGDDLGDVVCDSTDIFRDCPKYGSILGFVALLPTCAETFDNFFADYVLRARGV